MPKSEPPFQPSFLLHLLTLNLSLACLINASGLFSSVSVMSIRIIQLVIDLIIWNLGFIVLDASFTEKTPHISLEALNFIEKVASLIMSTLDFLGKAVGFNFHVLNFTLLELDFTE
jgi:hypothetical protein